MPISNNLRNAQNARSKLYKFAKDKNLNVHWRMKTNDMERVVNEFKLSKANTIIKSFRKAILKSDQSTLNAINGSDKKVEMTLGRFDRIRKNIISPADKKLLLHIKNTNGTVVKTYHLQDRMININNLFVDEENQYSSGADIELNVLPTSTVEVEWLNNPSRSRSERKNFFRYLTKADYKLEEFQVFAEDYFIKRYDDEADVIDYPCFLFSLNEAGVDTYEVKQISQTMYNSGATVDFIRKTAKAFGLNISVKQYYLNKKTGRAENNKSFYGDKNELVWRLNHSGVVNLGSVGGHLFAIKPTKITKAALNHPDLVREHGRTDFIVKNGRASFNSQRIKFLDSYEVISYLYHNRETHLKTITQQNMPLLINNKYQEVRELNESDFNEINFKPIGRRKTCEEKVGQAPFRKFIKEGEGGKFVDVEEYNIVYFDFETLVKDGKHVPYCVSYCIATQNSSDAFVVPEFGETKNIYGFKCAKKFLESLPKKSRNLLWAHNAGFDSRFLLKYLRFSSKDVNIIDSGTKLKQAKGFYKGREIVIKDTMSFLAGRLESLPKMFEDATGSLSLEKECFPHNLINKSNYKSMWSLRYLNSYSDKDTLLKNATSIGAIKDDKFDCQTYAIHYCNRDVDVLKTCFETFRKLVFDEYQLDVYRFLSISSLSLAYQHNEGCFDGCYEMNSVLLGFLREATVGGRVMTRDNQKHHTKHKLSDFDAVSLYPSAMVELPGYVKGKAKLFKNAIPSDADYYVARVRFDSIGKKRHFPLMSYYENGSRNFTNDIVGRTMIVGKQALEDMAEFQDATFTIIEGMYWNEGFNDQITKTIRKMFNARLKYKAEGNALQNVIKLMMNSSYGKLLMKPIVKQKVIVSGGQEKINDYTSKNIHKMISRTPINNKMALFEEHKALTQHFSPVHLGIQILDSSKHIMNRVMCLAEDIDAKIWYQDTDSMHIDYDAVSHLADAFKQKYNKELIGKQMGQFHTDFELEGSKGNIYAKESIFLGKKSYLDLLACDGNDVEGMHIRMKGIPSKLLEVDTYDIYIKLYNGESLSFDLSEICSIDINSKTQVISKRTSFTRKVSFS